MHGGLLGETIRAMANIRKGSFDGQGSWKRSVTSKYHFLFVENVIIHYILPFL
jgi:hypothetical protein